MERRFEVTSERGPAVRVGDRTVEPVARAVRVALPMPFGLVGLAWGSPSSVVVRDGGGGAQELAVVDVTRRAQIGIAVAGLVGGLLLALVLRRLVPRPTPGEAPPGAES
jgi:hypothetical protein